MKHLFYVLYVLIYTGAVFVCGMFVGQIFERSWARREKEVHAKENGKAAEPIGVRMPESHVAMTGSKRD